MKDVLNVLKLSSIFRNFSDEDISKLLPEISYRIVEYHKDDAVAIEGDKCQSIGIILQGKVEIQKLFASGKTVTIAALKPSDTFAEAIIFSDVSKYPATIVSSENTRIIFISKNDIISLCTINPKILTNFIGLLSNKILMLNKKIKNLSYQTIRQRVSSYILEEHQKQKKLTIVLPLSRQQMSEYLGIPRPSLSRELAHMKDEGLIDFNKNTVKILDIEALEFTLID
ncbi:MAG: Crp/Fnr family transcriptional regulator [Bacillota bacterium]|nr:Crp/Fnr family transcriptional regulator [Bacillota bacterium]